MLSVPSVSLMVSTVQTIDYLWCVHLLNLPHDSQPSSWYAGSSPQQNQGFGPTFYVSEKEKEPTKDSNSCFFSRSSQGQRLLDRLNSLLNHKMIDEPAGCETCLDAAPEGLTPETDLIGFMNVDDADADESTKRYLPMQRARIDHLFSHWMSVIPMIVHPYLEYLGDTLGKPLPQHASSLSACLRDYEKRSTNITCLYFDCKFPLRPMIADAVLSIH